MAEDRPRYDVPLEALERGARVPREEQAEAQEADPPRSYVAPEELDRLRTVADPGYGGTLRPGR